MAESGERSEDRPSTAPRDPFGLIGQTIAEKYRVIEVVGAGGFGVVYRGEHTGFGEPIAVKCLKLPSELGEHERKNLLVRLQDEGRVLHRLSKMTSGIVQALDVGAITTPSGQWVPYLVLEWLEGETLSQHLGKRRESGGGAMSLADAAALLGPAARALGVAHRQKIAHRDVKPENLYLTEVSGRRTMKVLDFGIAKVLTDTTFTAAAAATQQHPSAFTPSYGAPEQFNKKRGATGPWTDVFALALIFVEAASGKRALEGDDATQLYIAAADPAARPTLRYHGVETGDQLEQVLRRAMAISPQDRYPDADGFWDDLEKALEADPQSHRPPDVSDTGDFVSRNSLDVAAADAALEKKADEKKAVETGTPTVPLGQRAPVVVEEESPPPAKITTKRSRAEAPPPPSQPRGGTRWMVMVGILALCGAGVLYWQLQAIGEPPAPIASSTPRASVSQRPVQAGPPWTRPVVPSATPLPSAELDAGSEVVDAGEVDAAAVDAAAPVQTPPPGMVLIDDGDDAGGVAPFFLDRREVTTAAYRECVLAGRCPKATRIVLTEEVARALASAPDGDTRPAVTPEALASEWQPRCNELRGEPDHPVNCVNHGSAGDYCAFRMARLPTAAEWTLAASGSDGRRFPWGNEQPECGFACYGLNGTCVTHARQVGTCGGGVRSKDVSPFGVLDLGGNVAEWVEDAAGAASPGGPADRVVRGGSFLDDDAARLETVSATGVPPVTAHVSIGFRCALTAPQQ